ncbi:protein GPR108-like [Oncorhynchus keta]|uniref:protein GPR108-like n=1 Tax=Oncorhynchus keta TaxID=8018 RepID=UPI00227A6DF7|nr:protein GPR108-like [Oncorhynchus keta]
MGGHGGVGLAVFVLVLVFCEARRHKLALKNDSRFVVHLNTFGFFANGTLDVKVLSLRLPEDNSKHPVGFSLSKSRVNGVLSYTAEETAVCPLSKHSGVEPFFLFLIDTNNLRVNVRSYGDQDSVLTQLKTDKTLTKDSVSSIYLPSIQHSGVVQSPGRGVVAMVQEELSFYTLVSWLFYTF